MADGELVFTTQAGRELASWAAGDEPVATDDWLGHIAAIEQEARAALLAELRERVAGMMPTYPYTGAVVRSGVLREVLNLLASQDAPASVADS